MIRSKDKINQRLIDMTRVKYLHREGIRIGFNRFHSTDDEIKDQIQNDEPIYQV